CPSWSAVARSCCATAIRPVRSSRLRTRTAPCRASLACATPKATSSALCHTRSDAPRQCWAAKTAADCSTRCWARRTAGLERHLPRNRSLPVANRLAPGDVGLTDAEYQRIRIALGREPNDVELGMFGVLWSEHCSYKHSKPLLRRLPTTGAHVLQGP